MGILSNLFSNGASEAIKTGGEVADELFTSDEERLKNQAELEKIRQTPQNNQAEITKAEAQSENLFKSGWRPFIGWMSGFCLALYYIPQFILAAYLWTKLCIDQQQLLAYPITPTSLIEIICVLLGISGLRTYEKTSKGKNTRNI
jgi:hypothetical protein